MVLKTAIRYIINKYLKDYIEQLDYEKLKVDLKNGLCQNLFIHRYCFPFLGNVCLDNLHLKPEALVSHFLLTIVLLFELFFVFEILLTRKMLCFLNEKLF